MEYCDAELSNCKVTIWSEEKTIIMKECDNSKILIKGCQMGQMQICKNL